LRALPDVYGAMPATVTKALVLLDRALTIEPTYATAHGYAAMCHHCLFLRDGLQERNRMASVRHAQAALSHGKTMRLRLHSPASRSAWTRMTVLPPARHSRPRSI
jgi:hypothetical protein